MPGPVPPYSNVPINANYYNPNRFEISAITNGDTTIVTTTANHNYVIGQLVRLIIPESFRTYQLNEKEGYVLDIPASNQIELNINSSGFNTFVLSSATTRPQTLPVGNINSGVQNTDGRINLGTYIPGSFINVS